MKVRVSGESLHLYDIESIKGIGIEIELSQAELDEFKAVNKRYFELQDLVEDRIDESFRRETGLPDRRQSDREPPR